MHRPNAAKREVQRVFTLNQALTKQGKATLGDLVDMGLATISGQLANPLGYWSCPRCWMDYERPSYRQQSDELTGPAPEQAIRDAILRHINERRAAPSSHMVRGHGRGHSFDEDCVCIDCGFDGAEWHHWKNSTYEGKAKPDAKPPLCTHVGRPVDVYAPREDYWDDED